MKFRILALAAIAALAACSSGEEPPAPKPTPPAPVEPEPAPPEPEPAPARAADAAKGAQLYATYCASCHGAAGAGDGPVAGSLNPKPARHDDGAFMNAMSNEQLFAVIKLGGPAVGKSPMMAPWGGTLDDDQIRDVMAFVRSLADPPYTGAQP